MTVSAHIVWWLVPSCWLATGCPRPGRSASRATDLLKLVAAAILLMFALAPAWLWPALIDNSSTRVRSLASLWGSVGLLTLKIAHDAAPARSPTALVVLMLAGVLSAMLIAAIGYGVDGIFGPKMKFIVWASSILAASSTQSQSISFVAHYMCPVLSLIIVALISSGNFIPPGLPINTNGDKSLQIKLRAGIVFDYLIVSALLLACVCTKPVALQAASRQLPLHSLPLPSTPAKALSPARLAAFGIAGVVLVWTMQSHNNDIFAATQQRSTSALAPSQGERQLLALMSSLSSAPHEHGMHIARLVFLLMICAMIVADWRYDLGESLHVLYHRQVRAKLTRHRRELMMPVRSSSFPHRPSADPYPWTADCYMAQVLLEFKHRATSPLGNEGFLGRLWDRMHSKANEHWLQRVQPAVSS